MVSITRTTPATCRSHRVSGRAPINAELNACDGVSARLPCSASLTASPSLAGLVGQQDTVQRAITITLITYILYTPTSNHLGRLGSARHDRHHFTTLPPLDTSPPTRSSNTLGRMGISRHVRHTPYNHTIANIPPQPLTLPPSSDSLGRRGTCAARSNPTSPSTLNSVRTLGAASSPADLTHFLSSPLWEATLH